VINQSLTFYHTLDILVPVEVVWVHHWGNGGAGVFQGDRSPTSWLDAAGQEHETFLRSIIVEREGISEYLQEFIIITSSSSSAY
jgi:hypothetical protein